MPPAPSTRSTRYFPASSSPCWIMERSEIPRDGAPQVRGGITRRNQLLARGRGAGVAGVDARGGARTTARARYTDATPVEHRRGGAIAVHLALLTMPVAAANSGLGALGPLRA